MNTTINNTYINSNVINGISFNRNSTSNITGVNQVNITYCQINSKGGNAIYLRDNNTAATNRLNFNISYNNITSDNNGSLTNLPLVHLYSPSLLSLTTVPINRIFNYNRLINRYHNIGFEATNLHGITSSSYNKIMMDASASYPQTAGYYYNNCMFITENSNAAGIDNFGSNINYDGLNYPSFSSIATEKITPIGFIYNNVTGTLANPSVFTCNTIGRDVSTSFSMISPNSGVLFQGNCTNSYLTRANLNARKYGILIAPNTVLSEHIARGNKFYCNSNSQFQILSKISSPGLFTTGFNSPATALNGLCPNIGSGSCAGYGSNGFVYFPLGILSPTSIMVKSTDATKVDTSYPQSCPICIPLPFMAPPQAPPVSTKSIEPNCQLSPNPTSASTEVILDQPTSQEAQLYIYDMSGRLLIEASLRRGITEYKLDANKLQKGTYQLLVREANKIICSQKLIIEK
jgi:Secretion system C-terminal sorting domain